MKKSITYDMNSSDPDLTTPEPTKYNVGIGGALSKPTCEGYKFKGWTTIKDDPSTLINPLGLAEYDTDITVYALLEPLEVNYRLNIHYPTFGLDKTGKYHNTPKATMALVYSNLKGLTGTQYTVSDFEEILPTGIELVTPDGAVPYCYTDSNCETPFTAPAIPTVKGDGTTVIDVYARSNTDRKILVTYRMGVFDKPKDTINDENESLVCTKEL